MGCSGGALGGGRSSSGSRPVGAGGGAGSGGGGAGASRTMPSYQSRAGWNHSITIAAVTIAGTTLAPGNPTKKKLVTKSGTASPDSASRAALERCNAYQPSTAAAAAATAVTVHTTRSSVSMPCTSTPSWSPGGLERYSSTASRVSSECSTAPWPSAMSTTTTEPPTISHPANVAWGGRTIFGSLMAPV